MPASPIASRRLLLGLLPALSALLLGWFFWARPSSGVSPSSQIPQDPPAAVQEEAPRAAANLGATPPKAGEEPVSATQRRELAGQAIASLDSTTERLIGSLRDARSGAPIVDAELRWSPPRPGTASASQALDRSISSAEAEGAELGSEQRSEPLGAGSTARSDSRGQFELPWPGPGLLSCHHPDYVSVRYPALEPTDGLVVLMERAASLRVRVLDPDDGPIVAALVEVWRCDGVNPLAEVTAEARTDDDGIALLTGLRAGNFLVRGTPPAADTARPGWTRHALESGVAVASGGRADVRLTLFPGSSLAIRLETESEEEQPRAPAQRASLEACLVTLDPHWDVLPSAIRQAAQLSKLVALDGFAEEFGPLDDGPLTIVCWTPWAQRFEFSSAVPRKDPLRLRLPVGAPWHGVVRAEGQPLEGALVAIVEATRSGELSYQAAKSLWDAQEQSKSAAVASSADLPTGGSNTPASGGADAGSGPLSSVAALSAPNRLLVTATDSRGQFLFPRRPADVELYCLVWPPDYRPGADPGSLAPTGGRISSAGFLQHGRTWVPPEFELRRTAGLQGWVRCSDGASSAGARLQLRVAEARAAEPALSAEASADGAFRFEAVSNQALILEAHLEGYKPVSLSVPAVADPREVRPPAIYLELEPVFTVHGQVLDWEGRAQSGALVRATIDRMELGSATTDQAGAFVLEGLPRGLVQFSASAAETSRTTGTERLLRLPSAEPLVLRLRQELPGRMASVAGRAIRAGSASDGTQGSAVPGLFARGLGPYAVLHQTGSAYRIEGLRPPVFGFELGAPGYESVRIVTHGLSPGGHLELPQVELQRSIAVHFTGLNEVLIGLDPGRGVVEGFVLLVPLSPDLGGTLGDRMKVDLAHPGPEEARTEIWRLTAAAFEVQLPTLGRSSVLDLTEAPEELEVHLPSLLKAPDDSGE